MKECPYCGQPNPEERQFCEWCGTDLDECMSEDLQSPPKDIFTDFLSRINPYLKTNKQFIINPPRYKQLVTAVRMAQILFPDAKIELHDDPLQTGAQSIHIETYDITFNSIGKTEIFAELLLLSDVWEIYPRPDGDLDFNLTFNKVYILLPEAQP